MGDSNAIEVKQVSEGEIANIFTFFNASHQSEQRQSLPVEEQLTFQASAGKRDVTTDAVDVYLT